MMLERIRLQNYRCFDRHEVTFHPVSVVVGANNAGKSTLVEALRLLGLVVGKYKTLTYTAPPPWTNLPASTRGVAPSMGDIDLRGGSVFHRYGDPPAKITADFSNGTSTEVYVGRDNRIFGTVHDALGNVIRTKAQARRVDIPAIAILPQIGPLIENEQVLTASHVAKSADTSLASRHFRNQLHQAAPAAFEEFRRRAAESWHGLNIESLNIEGEAPSFLSLHVRDGGFVAEVGWMGHGLQMWLQTMWFLVRAAQAATVILDEPDVYMHADLQRRLIRLLKGRSGQTVIATHSVEIMSEVDPDDILIVDKARPKSSFAARLPAVQAAIDQIGGVHNIHLARLWGAKKCLHVEGKDVAFLKLFQGRLYPASDAPIDTIPRLSIGGWAGWNFAIGATMAFKNSAGEDIAAYCILDSDYHTDEEVERRYEEASRHNVRLHIWKMKEIENYLLVPEAIARVIADGTHDPGKAPSPQEVDGKIEEIGATMKDQVFDALSHEYISLNRGGGVSKANKKARKRIDEAWTTRSGRFALLPGKEVISRLSQWSQEQFTASFGALRIARSLRESEFPSEIKQVVRAIERSQKFPVSLSRRR